MNSRISIDVNEDNQPIVIVDYKSSGDVRDKLVKRFLEGFGGGAWARIQFTGGDPTSQSVEIRALSFKDLEEESKVIKSYVDFHNR